MIESKTTNSTTRRKLTDEDRAKGRATITPRRRLANSLNPMKHGKNSKYPQLVMEMAKDPNINALDILNSVHLWEKKATKFQEGMQIIDRKIQAFKTIHGERKISVHADATERMRKWYDFEETEEV